jgi:predicted component of type VI protein secretion system
MSGLWLVPANGEPIRVEKDPAAVGRDPRADVVLTHPSVSRRHAVLERTTHGWMVADQNSGNGTWIDGQRVIRALLRPGQTVRFGALTFTVSLEAPSARAGEPVHPGMPPYAAPRAPAAPARAETPVRVRQEPVAPAVASPSAGSQTPSPAGVMSAAEAAEILGLSPAASVEDVRRTYQRIYNDLQIRLTNAPTATLKRMYQKNLQNLKIAAEVLAPGVVSRG